MDKKQPEALRRSTAADGKTELFNLPGYPLMVRAVDFNRIHTESEMRRTALLDEMQKATPPAEQQAEPGAVGRTGCTAGTDEECTRRGCATTCPALQAAPKAAPGVGNSGFDHQTAANFLNGKTVSDEAVRKFVKASRWAHDERAALSATLLAMHGVLTSREAEIALLKKALLEAETATQQEAQEPATVPYQKLTNEIDQILSDPDTELSIGAKRALLWVRTWVSVPLWTTPQPAPDCHHRPPCDECAAIAAQGGK